MQKFFLLVLPLIITQDDQTCIVILIIQGPDKPCNTIRTVSVIRNPPTYRRLSQYVEGCNGNLKEHFHYSLINHLDP